MASRWQNTFFFDYKLLGFMHGSLCVKQSGNNMENMSISRNLSISV